MKYIDELTSLEAARYIVELASMRRTVKNNLDELDKRFDAMVRQYDLALELEGRPPVLPEVSDTMLTDGLPSVRGEPPR